MKTTSYYLDELSKLTKTGSDYSIAKLLKTNDSRISQYRNSGKNFDDEMCVKVSALLALDVLEIMAAMNYARAKTDAKKEFWKSVFINAETKNQNLKTRQGVAKRLAVSGIEKSVDLHNCILCKIQKPLILSKKRPPIAIPTMRRVIM